MHQRCIICKRDAYDGYKFYIKTSQDLHYCRKCGEEVKRNLGP
jgi:NAD-dependent SIR2 family protein deacetylase